MKDILKSWIDKPEQCALKYDASCISYRELLLLSCQLGNLFNQYKYEKILFCIPNMPSLVICYLAGWLSGKTLLPVNPRLTNHELLKIIDEHQPDFILFEETRLLNKNNQFFLGDGEIYTIKNDAAKVGTFWDALLIQEKTMPIGYDPNALTIHLTSGTTGCYKSVPHTLSQIEQYAVRRSKDFEYRLDDRILIVTSLNHAFSFSYQFLPAIVLGLSITLIPSFSPKVVYDAMIKHKITSLALLPVMSYQLAQYAQDKKQKYLLRYVLVAGDALPAAFNDLFMENFGAQLFLGIGMTEVFGYAQNFISNTKTGSAGLLLEGVQLKIIDKTGQVLRNNEVGEIYLKTEMNLSNYGNDISLTKNFITKDGWLKTGDIGYLDNDNFLWFMGRKKQIIIKGGSNISPAEVEQALYKDPNILEAGVIGKKDDIWGQVIWAYISIKANITFDESALISFLANYIAKYKIPQKILLLASLPKTSSGKIDRNQLIEWAEQANDATK